MESIVKVIRIFRNEPDNITGKPGEPRKSRGVVDLRSVSDYEEYKGELCEAGKDYTLILTEFNMVTEYKIIEMGFDKFHDMYCKYRKFMESKEGFLKMN